MKSETWFHVALLRSKLHHWRCQELAGTVPSHGPVLRSWQDGPCSSSPAFVGFGLYVLKTWKRKEKIYGISNNLTTRKDSTKPHKYIPNVITIPQSLKGSTPLGKSWRWPRNAEQQLGSLTLFALQHTSWWSRLELQQLLGKQANKQAKRKNEQQIWYVT